MVRHAVVLTWVAVYLISLSSLQSTTAEDGHHHHHRHEHDEVEHHHGEREHGEHGHHGKHDHGEHHHGDHDHGEHHAEHRKGAHHDTDHHHHGKRRDVQESAGVPQHRWVEAYVSALSMSIISFVGVVFIAFVGAPKLEAYIEYFCLAFAGSVLVGDALLHLLPHALEGADHDAMTRTGVAGVVGALFILVIPELCGGHEHGHSHGHSDDLKGQVKAYGIANLVVEMIHNFVDGISIGLSWMAGGPAGLGATIAVAVHELPQELGDFVVLRAAGFSTPRLLFFNFLASLTCVGGVGLAHYIGQEATLPLQRILMAFTAGSFLALALNMIFPQVSESIAKHHTGVGRVYAKLSCLVAAVLAVVILIKVGELESGHGHDHEGHGHGHAHTHGHSHGHHHSHTEM